MGIKPRLVSIPTDSRLRPLLLGILPVATKTASTSKCSAIFLVVASVSSIFTGQPGIIFVAKTFDLVSISLD